MKTFRLFGIIMMLVMGMAFTACSDDDDDNGGGGRYPLTGTWIGEADGEQVIAVFNGDGSGHIYDDLFDDYKIEEGTILIKWEGDDEFDFEGYIEIGDGQFRTRYDVDEDWITFYKQ